MQFPRSTEDVEQDYSACLDSVAVIDRVEAIASADRNDDDIDDVRRNVEHLELYAPLTDWGDKNLTPLTAAITLGKSIMQN
tara:strand:+ start:636 stop:878 length:243 start_codon:yes stop_codon:yes gene_type:complete